MFVLANPENLYGHWLGTFRARNRHETNFKKSCDLKSHDHKSELVRSAGVEPTTLGFGNRYSIQLSYERVFEKGTETAK